MPLRGSAATSKALGQPRRRAPPKKKVKYVRRLRQHAINLPIGEWTSQPERARWHDLTTGYECLSLKNNLGTLCGYVRVPRDHALYRVRYTRIEERIGCHGGLTFSGRPGTRRDAKRGHWFGFDCAHYNDITPAFTTPEHRRFGIGVGGVYRTLDYVRSECAALAMQLKTKA